MTANNETTGDNIQTSTCPKREEFAGAILSDAEDELRDEAEARRREDVEEMQGAMKEGNEHDDL